MREQKSRGIRNQGGEDGRKESGEGSGSGESTADGDGYLCNGLRHKDLGFVRTGIVNASSVAKSTPFCKERGISTGHDLQSSRAHFTQLRFSNGMRAELCVL